ncbi:MAG: sugar phosphate nucleotidyltransferase, partial [Salegentibacter mishustinae]|nr:sugar phosphate nucleotidyltransferase [Salegentibacter mishustinae]
PAFFGDDIVESLEGLAKSLNAKASIYRQDQPLGTGHAIMSAKESLSGPAVVAYADTLIKADFKLDKEADAVIWTKKVANPEAFGVVNLNEKNEIIELVEKPKDFVSDQAVIGIYYFKDIAVLKEKLEEVLDENLMHGGEYQINDGIKKMMAEDRIFKTGTVDEWMDCGNKNVTVETNGRMLNFLHQDGEKLISDSVKITNSEITEPCYIGENVELVNAKIGPNVSVGDGTKITDAEVKNSLIQTFAEVRNAKLDNAMIGNFAKFDGNFTQISIGDYSTLE